MENIMSKTNDTERTRELEAKRAELLHSELDTVTGGVSDLGKYITKAVDDALVSPSGAPEVWVGCAWVRL
jgi:hypothetical protein